MKRLAFFIIICMVLMTGCTEDPRYDKAIEAVKQSDSIAAGTSTAEYMAQLFAASEKLGNAIVRKGWYSTIEYSRERGGQVFNVFFDASENGREIEFHWVIDKDNVIIPVNDWAVKVTPRQKAKTGI